MVHATRKPTAYDRPYQRTPVVAVNWIAKGSIE
jgi:hypothetical protein